MTSNIFGTSGIRRVFQNYSDKSEGFTPQMAVEVGLALGSYLRGGTVVIGKDIRTSALPIEHGLISGLVSCGTNVKSLGIVTTPTLAMSLRFLKADAGCMITASHNTPEYIGLKLWNTSGVGFSPEQEEEIERIYNEKDFVKTEWDGVGKLSIINDINDVHISEIIEKVNLDGSKLHIIIDPGNGTGCDIVPKLLSAYRIDHFTSINANMSGNFPGRLSEPSKENLEQISKFLRISTQEEIGIALDGDADRVIFLDEDGEIVDPIRLMTLLAKFHIKEYKGQYPKDNMKIATPINSSSLIENVLEPLGCQVIRTEVGDIKVAIALKEQGGFLGGETSGTYIWPEFHYGPDSIVTIAKVLNVILTTNKSLKELLKDIPNYPYFADKFKLKKDIPFTSETNELIIKEMNEFFDSIGKKLKNVNMMDGCRFDYEDGWLLIRRSGTSPFLRISGESNKTMDDSIEMNRLTKERMQTLDLI